MRCLSVNLQVSAAVLCVLLVCARASAARAAGVVGTGSADSCTDAALDAALENGGLVTFNCGGPATIDISTGTGTKRITTATTIDGGGMITISGGNVHQVFEVYIATFTVRNLTIANARGGAIQSSLGLLTFINSTFTDNVESRFAGVIRVDAGWLTVANCTFSRNSGLYVGAIATVGATILSVTNSTFSGNSGGIGAAIAAFGGTATITNSTFTRNMVSDPFDGGTIYYADPASVVLRNTIIESIGDPNCSGETAPTDGGHNLDDGLSCGFSVANGSLSDTDPHLDPTGLQDNGGSTQTVALCTAVDEPEGCTAASPAIDAGDPSACADAPVNDRDQRGFVRPGATHTNCSIGAYEAEATEPICVGDCDGDGRVAINELVLGVNILLESQPVSACPAFDRNNSNTVTIEELIQGVNNLLGACPA